MPVVNAYTVVPAEIKQGDEMYFVVKALVLRKESDGTCLYRLYRCAYNGEPLQGSQIMNQAEVCEVLFPSLAIVGEPI